MKNLYEFTIYHCSTGITFFISIYGNTEKDARYHLWNILDASHCFVKKVEQIA